MRASDGKAGDLGQRAGASYPLEVARRALAERRAAEPAPLDDPWFIDEEPAAAAADPSYEAWVTAMESYPPPPRPRAARRASPLAALYFL